MFDPRFTSRDLAFSPKSELSLRYRITPSSAPVCGGEVSGAGDASGAARCRTSVQGNPDITGPPT